MRRLKNQIERIKFRLYDTYHVRVLTTRQACQALLFRGRELSAVLHSNKLPSLKIEDVARYIVFHT